MRPNSIESQSGAKALVVTAPSSIEDKRRLLAGYVVVFVVVFVGVFLSIFAVVKTKSMETELRAMREREWRLRGGDDGKEAAAAAASSRRKRNDNAGDARAKVSAIGVVTDYERTKSEKKNKGAVEFPANFRDIKWRLFRPTPKPDARVYGVLGSALGFGSDDAAESTVHAAGADFDFDAEEGAVVIKESGLYYVYSQLTFYSLANRLAYFVEINDRAELACKVEQQVDQVSLRACDSSSGRLRLLCLESLYLMNSCHTSAMRHLRAGDRVRVRGESGEQMAIVGEKYSFFGIVKL